MTLICLYKVQLLMIYFGTKLVTGDVLFHYLRSVVPYPNNQRRKDMYKTIDDIALFLGLYIANNLTEWIYKQGGWVSIFMMNLLFFMMYELYVSRPIIFEIIMICLLFFHKDFDTSFDCN